MVPLLLIAIPTVLALGFGLLCYKTGGGRLARFLRDYKTGRLIVALTLLISGSLGAVCLDLLDVSDLLFEDQKRLHEQRDQFFNDLKDNYEVTEKNFHSISNRVRLLTNEVKPEQSMTKATFLGLGVGLFAAIYLFASILHTGAEGILEEQLSASEGKTATVEEEMRKKLVAAATTAEIQRNLYQSVEQILRQMEKVVVSKCNRTERTFAKFQPGLNPDDRGRLLAEAVAPREQVQTLVLAAHHFFSKGMPGEQMRLALFVPKGNSLVVIASTDGNSPDVVTSPNKENANRFILNTQMPLSAAVEVFQTKIPIISAKALEDPRFKPFCEIQRQKVKSFFACPLGYPPSQDIGVLCADVNIEGYFEDSEHFRTILSLMGGQVALRARFEDCMAQLCALVRG